MIFFFLKNDKVAQDKKLQEIFNHPDYSLIAIQKCHVSFVLDPTFRIPRERDAMEEYEQEARTRGAKKRLEDILYLEAQSKSADRK
jgi:hypothetical protein